MAETRYSWRPGSRIVADANKVGRELDRMEKELHRKLLPADVLERARSANSPTHSHFEWDDSKAAEAHRLTRASELIRSIEIDVSRSNLSTKTVRAFVSVEREGERSYTGLVHAMSDATLRLQLIRRAWDDFDALRRKHQGLSELAAIFEAVERSRP